MIPASIIIVTKDIAGPSKTLFKQVLESLQKFDDIWIVHSGDTSQISSIAKQPNMNFVPFVWNEQYPKKRQWCLDNIKTKYDWVFFLDADEMMFPDLAADISATLNRADINSYAGFFVKGGYIWDGRPLKHGLKNNKIALLHKKRCHYPIINDLNETTMGEIEGHYQPISKDEKYKIGQLKTTLTHYAFIDKEKWLQRHKKYAQWEAFMIKSNQYPKDPTRARQVMKYLFHRTPNRALIAFLHCYIIRLGFIDGRDGYEFAKTRHQYYRMVRQQYRDQSSITLQSHQRN